MIRTKFAKIEEDKTHFKSDHRFCNWCGSVDIEEGEHDAVYYRWRCSVCEREYYQRRNAQWQKFCSICHKYIDPEALCMCFTSKRRGDVPTEEESQKEEGSTEALSEEGGEAEEGEGE